MRNKEIAKILAEADLSVGELQGLNDSGIQFSRASIDVRVAMANAESLELLCDQLKDSSKASADSFKELCSELKDSSAASSKQARSVLTVSWVMAVAIVAQVVVMLASKS